MSRRAGGELFRKTAPIVGERGNEGSSIKVDWTDADMGASSVGFSLETVDHTARAAPATYTAANAALAMGRE